MLPGEGMRRFRIAVVLAAGLAFQTIAQDAMARDVRVHDYVMRIHNHTRDHIRVECNGQIGHPISAGRYHSYRFKSWRRALVIVCYAMNHDGEEIGDRTVSLSASDPRAEWNVE